MWQFQQFWSCRQKLIGFSVGFTYKLNKVQRRGGVIEIWRTSKYWEEKSFTRQGNILSTNSVDIERLMETRYRGTHPRQSIKLGGCYAPWSAAVRLLQATHLWNALRYYLNMYRRPHGSGPREVLICPWLDGGNICARASYAADLLNVIHS
jgi:hypothetical protein